MDDTVLLAKVMAFEIGLNGDSRVRDPCKMQQNLRNFTSKNPPPFSFHTLSVRKNNKRGYTVPFRKRGWDENCGWGGSGIFSKWKTEV